MTRRLFRTFSIGLGLSILALGVLPVALSAQVPTQEQACGEAELYCPAQSTNVLSDALGSVSLPDITAPEPPPPPKPVVTYDVMTRGVITAELADFKALVSQTLNDSRGWARLGVTFREVAANGRLTIALSQAAQMTSFSPTCDTVYSCAVGRYVIINQDRWLSASQPWNAAGLSLRDYRHLVVNHEVGHWLGHDHPPCPGPGQPAAVMQQQSLDLGGCVFNPWPIESELWSTTLGIKQ